MTRPVLEGARIRLRPITHDDSSFIVTQMNDWSIVRWLSGPPYPYAEADAQWFVENFADEAWAIDDGQGMIGTIGFRSDLGYWLSPAHHGRGIMTEAAEVALAWHFAQSHAPLTSGYFLGNAASETVLRKMGFVDTHIESQFALPQNKDVMVQRMALTPADWEVRNG